MRSARLFTLLVVVLSLLAAAPVRAEVSQEGNLLGSFEGGMSPNALPRSTPVPVAVRVGGGVKTTKGAPLPQLRNISVAINSAGRLYDKGLPICRVKSIQPATEAEARATCPGAIVGSGHVAVIAHIPSQAPFAIEGKLLAFNGPRHHGQKLILAQVYSHDPLGAFVLTFKVQKRGGIFGTLMSTTLPPSARGWAYITHFDMTLKHTWRYRGKLRSYVSAACAAPAGFPGAVFPFAKASYGFDNGQELTTTLVRSCRVG